MITATDKIKEFYSHTMGVDWKILLSIDKVYNKKYTTQCFYVVDGFYHLYEYNYEKMKEEELWLSPELIDYIRSIDEPEIPE